MFWFTIIIIICGILCFDYYHKKRVHNYIKHLPGPNFSFPIMGDAWLFFGTDTSKFFELLSEFQNTYGRVCRLWLFNKCFVIIQSAEYAEAIFMNTQNIKKNFLYDMLRPWLSDGLLLSKGIKWRVRRKIITPTFHFKVFEQFISIFNQSVSRLINRLDDKADGGTSFDIYPEVCLATLDAILETAMGVRINAQERPNLAYVKAIASVTAIIADRVIRPVLYYDPIYNITHFLEKMRFFKNIDIIHKFTDEVIRERRKTLNQRQKILKHRSKNSDDTNGNQNNRVVFLDFLLEATQLNGESLSNNDIREEVDTFMFEGHDTTTSGISHIIYLLAHHSREQLKVFQEVERVMNGNNEKPFTVQNVQELKYLECVIKEGLRLYPSVPLIGRILEENTQIKETIIPAGTNIIISLYNLLRDPKYFYDPDDFIPERFNVTSNHEKRHPFAYVPFSAGPRNCIGQKFAMFEMKIFIGKLVQHFELLPLGPKVSPVMNLILRSSTGVHIGLKRRLFFKNL